MKYLVIFALILSGCATASEYSQGCRDGIIGITQLKDNGRVHIMIFDDTSYIDHNEDAAYYCDMLDAKHRRLERESRL